MAFTATGAAGRAAASAAAQSWSRGPSSAVSCGRCHTTTASGFAVAASIAACTIGRYGSTLLPSSPHDAVTMAFGCASSSRAASSGAAKPPNTTEWTAPIRAHASIATTASVIIGR